MKNNIILFYITFLIFSCNSKDSFDSYQSSKENLKVIRVDDMEHVKSLDLDKIFQVQKVVELGAVDSVFIINNDKVLVTENQIFIMDKSKTHSIYVYSEEGEFLYSISNFGEGPNEYREIRDFTIDPSNSKLSILDFASRTIWIYEMSTGKLREKVSIENNINYTAFEEKEGNLIYFHGNNCGLLDDCKNITFSTNLLDSSFFTIPQNLRGFDLKSNQVFSRNGSDIYFSELLNDTIYEMEPSNMSISALYAIDFGNFKISTEFKYSNANESANELIQYTLINRKTIGINEFFVSDSILYFNFGIPDLRQAFYNKYSGRSISFDKFRTSNLLLIGEIVSVHENSFVALISDETLISLKRSADSKDSVMFRESNPEMYEIIKDRDVGSNPVLVFLKVKL